MRARWVVQCTFPPTSCTLGMYIVQPNASILSAVYGNGYNIMKNIIHCTISAYYQSTNFSFLHCQVLHPLIPPINPSIKITMLSHRLMSCIHCDKHASLAITKPTLLTLIQREKGATISSLCSQIKLLTNLPRRAFNTEP